MRHAPSVLIALLATSSACKGDIRLVDTDETDVYTVQQTVPPADVLFVVDDSGSMSEEQARIAADVSAMVDVLVGAQTDVHVGVVTTDVEGPDAGVMIGGVLADTEAIRASLAGALLAGVDGARTERGLEAARLALDGRNAGFRRDDATLDVLVLTDEDDHSTGETGEYLVDFQLLAPEGFRMDGVVGDLPEGCFSEDGAAEASARYVELIELTGGFQESICAPDYRGVLERLGLDLVGTADTFPLSDVPVVDTLEVEVDGDAVAMDEAAGWTYDPAANAVIFHGDAVPQPGQEVVIRYQRLAGGSVGP